jgi:hypothetical protein
MQHDEGEGGRHMAWMKVDDRLAFHRKVLAAKNEAVGAWVRAGSWSSGEGTDGMIPIDTALTIAPLRVWKRLCQVVLAHEVADGFELHDYLDYNPRAEANTAARAENLTRKREAGRLGGLRSGASRRSKTGSTREAPCASAREAPASNSSIVREAESKQNEAPIPIPIPIPEEIKTPGAPEAPVEAKAPEVLPPPTDSSAPRFSRMEDTYWRDAYADTVRETTGTPWVFPDKQLSGLRAAVQHCPTPSEVDGWIRSEVAAFVRAVRPKPKVWSSFGPDGFLSWLNAQRPVEDDGRGPTIANAPPRKLAIHRVLGEGSAEPSRRPREASPGSSPKPSQRAPQPPPGAGSDSPMENGTPHPADARGRA